MPSMYMYSGRSRKRSGSKLSWPLGKMKHRQQVGDKSNETSNNVKNPTKQPPPKQQTYKQTHYKHTYPDSNPNQTNRPKSITKKNNRNPCLSLARWLFGSLAGWLGLVASCVSVGGLGYGHWQSRRPFLLERPRKGGAVAARVGSQVK